MWKRIKENPLKSFGVGIILTSPVMDIFLKRKAKKELQVVTIKDFEDKNSKEQLFYPLLLIKSAISKTIQIFILENYESFQNF